MLNMVQMMQKGKTPKQIQKEIDAQAGQKSKAKGKCFGECESCGQKTVLVEVVGLCGPCCFGEADTFNGNW